MRGRSILTALLGIALAALACNMPNIPDPEGAATDAVGAPATTAAPDDQAATDDPGDVMETEAPTEEAPQPSATPVETGFTTAPYDVTQLGPLPIVGGVGGYHEGCHVLLGETDEHPDAPLTPPAVTAFDTYLGFNLYYFCVLGFPTNAGDTFVAELVSPDGDVYLESYEVLDGGGMRGMGYASTWDFDPVALETDQGTSVVTITLDLPASLPQGEWVARAYTMDRSLERFDIFTLTHEDEWTSIERTLRKNPFTGAESKTFTDGETALITGKNYSPNTDYIVALYVRPPSDPEAYEGLPVYATQITADSNGAWQTAFNVGPEVPADDYFLLIGETPDTMFFRILAGLIEVAR